MLSDQSYVVLLPKSVSMEQQMRRENKDLFRAEELYCKKYSSQEMRPRNRSYEIYFIRCCGCEQQGSSGMVRGVGFLHNLFSSRCSLGQIKDTFLEARGNGYH